MLDLQVGKGLSKDQKAQKLALQHWLEAVSLVDPRFISLSNLHLSYVGLLAINRLILDIAMVTISISTMTIGSTVKAGSPSSTGTFAESRFLDGF